MRTFVALIVVAAWLWLSQAKRYPCSEIGCPHFCFEDGDLCPSCLEWLANCEPLGPPSGWEETAVRNATIYDRVYVEQEV